MNIITKQLFALATALVGGVTFAHAAPFALTNGDLVLGVQATGGVGATKNVFFNLGPGTALRDIANQGLKGNINTTLTSVFGANWYSRSDVHFGVIANLRGNPNSGFGSAIAVNGDPSRTFYLSTATDSPNTGTLIAAATYPGASLGAAATTLSGMEDMLITLTAEADNSAILDQTTQSVEWSNGWSSRNPVPGAGFGVFTGGIQQSFGKLTSSTYVDIQRILSTNTDAVPTGVIGGGTYESTVAISSTGAISVNTAPFAFTDGDLIVGVQATGGVGATKNVFFNLGSGTALRDNVNQGVKGNINATLTSAFGANWYTRTDLYFGVIANLRGNANSGFGSAPAVNNDPSRTFYLSTTTESPGAGALIAANTYPGSSLGAAATTLSGMETMLVTLYTEADHSTILDQTTQSVEWSNGWSSRNPVPGASFGVFTGGIQQSFGKLTSSTYVDIQRVLSTNTGAIPTGVVGGGTYESTVAISSTGAITVSNFAYDRWIATFTSITAPADQLPTADPDGDSANNLREFAFGGNPENGADQGGGQVLTADANADTLSDITLTVEVRSDAVFAPSGNDLLSGLTDELTYRVEGSTDLVTWDSAVSEVVPQIGSGSPSSGYVFKTFRLNGGNGLVGKGFLRASVVK